MEWNIDIDVITELQTISAALWTRDGVLAAAVSFYDSAL